MSTFAEKLKALRLKREVSQTEVSEATGLSRSRLSMYEGGRREPDFATLCRLSNYFGVHLYDLLPDSDDGVQGSIPVSTQRVPVLGSIHAGDPTFAEEDFEAYVEAGSSIRCDFALRVVGDSMIGARIEDGDIVFIRKQDTVDNGEIAAVLIDDETTLKRVRFLPGGLTMLSPENPRYEPIIVGGENETRVVRILGKAVAFQSDVR